MISHSSDELSETLRFFPSLGGYYARSRSRRQHYLKRTFWKTNKDFASLLGMINHSSFTNTEVEIQVSNIPWNIDKSVIKQRLGIPRFILQNRKEVTGHSVWHYKISYPRHYLQLHFLNDKFVASGILIHPKHLESLDLAPIHFLAQKYGTSETTLSLQDHAKNKLWVSNTGFDLRLCYVSGAIDLSFIPNQHWASFEPLGQVNWSAWL